MARGTRQKIDTKHRGYLTSEAPAATCPIERPLTAEELAPILGLHKVTLLRWAREGRVPSRRLSARKVVFLPSEINKWLTNSYAGDAGRAAQPV
jgi:excisionase family DNA binding protein